MIVLSVSVDWFRTFLPRQKHHKGVVFEASAILRYIFSLHYTAQVARYCSTIQCMVMELHFTVRYCTAQYCTQYTAQHSSANVTAQDVQL